MAEYKPATVFGFAIKILFVVTAIATMIYGHKFSYVLKISAGYMISAVLMVILPLVTQELNAGAAFAADISILVVFGLFGGIIQSSTFALGAMLPPKYMGALMFGSGICGITLNLVRAICLLSIPDDSFKGALVYFIMGAFFLVISAYANWKF